MLLVCALPHGAFAKIQAPTNVVATETSLNNFSVSFSPAVTTEGEVISRYYVYAGFDSNYFEAQGASSPITLKIEAVVPSSLCIKVFGSVIHSSGAVLDSGPDSSCASIVKGSGGTTTTGTGTGGTSTGGTTGGSTGSTTGTATVSVSISPTYNTAAFYAKISNTVTGTKFKVDYSSKSNSGSEQASTTSAQGDLSILLKNLTENTSYSYSLTNVSTGKKIYTGNFSTPVKSDFTVNVKPEETSVVVSGSKKSGSVSGTSLLFVYSYAGKENQKSFTLGASGDFSFPISDLIPGATYAYSLKDATGTTSYTTGSFTTLFTSLAPTSPTDVKVEKGSYGTAIVSFTPPKSASPSSGSQIKYYIVRTTPDVGSFSSGNTSPITVSGIENGKSYKFEVRAVDTDGFMGPYSKITSSLLFKWEGASLVPGIPSNIVATPDDMSVKLTFTEPPPASSSAGSKIQYYSVRITPDGRTFASGPTSPITVVGLENGKGYQFEIRAVDTDGIAGPYSAITKKVIPNGPVTLYPTAPLNVRATAGDKEATVFFDTVKPVTSSPGSRIKFYAIQSTPEGIYASNTTSPISVKGLINGKTYSFTVRAQDSDGFWGSISNSSNPVKPSGTPNAPRNVTAKSGNTGATVYWQAPENDGGFPITSYTVELVSTDENNGFKHTTTKGTSLYVSNLTNGLSYTFRVLATNSKGDGPTADSNEVIPIATGKDTGGIDKTDGDGSDSNNVSDISKYFQIKNPLKSSTMEEFVARVLDALVLLLTPLLVLALIASGFLFVKARGNPEELSTAKRILMYTLVGAALVLGAKVIASALTNTLNQF